MTEQQQEQQSELPQWIRNHVQRYLETDGADGHLWDFTAIGGPPAVPTLLLTVKGRRSGQERTLPLIYGRSGDDYVVVASRGGHPTHPGWYLNLCAAGLAKVQVCADRFEAVPRTASGEERAELWKMMSALYPPYDDYQVRAGKREIPVVVLRRVD